MKASVRLVTPLVRFILGRICRIDAGEFGRVPARGPLIIVTNHVNFLEVPLLYTCLHPRGIVGLVKAETWDIPGLGFLARVWEAIPINREATDTSAMKAALDTLARGKILIVAPEGTRSGDGRLQKGHGGVVQLAARSGAPIIPVATFGGERFWENIRKPRRTRIAFRVGAPFRLALPEGGLTKGTREGATGELMRRIARLLPERYRGAYAEGLETPDRYLADIEG